VKALNNASGFKSIEAAIDGISVPACRINQKSLRAVAFS